MREVLGIGPSLLPLNAKMEAGVLGIGTRLNADGGSGTVIKASDNGFSIVDKLTSFVLFEPISRTSSDFVFGNYNATAVVGNYNFGLYWGGGGATAFVRNVAGTAVGTASVAFTVGKPQLWVLTYDGANIRLYVEGILRATQPQTGNVNAELLQVAIAGWQEGTIQTKTYLAGIANQAWNDAQVATITTNPWQLFRSPQRLMLTASAPVGIQPDAASNSGYQTAQTTYSFSRTVTGSNTFLAVDVEILSVPGTTVTGITDDGVAITFIGAQSTVSGAGRVECWGIANPTAGTKTISVTLSASVNSAATATSYTGVNQSVPTEAFNSAQATNVGAADASVVITTVADNCYVHAAVSTNDMAVTAGQVTRNNVSGAAGSGANEDNGAAKTPAGAVTMSYTGVDALATWAIAGYAIRPLAASTPATGTFASTLANATLASSGTVADVGSFASTLGNTTMAASGSVGSVPSGAFASTLAGFTMAATGTLNDSGAFASTLGGVSMAAAGIVAPNITGTFATTMGAATMSAGGYVGTPPVITGGIVRRRLRPRVYQRTAAP